MTREGRLVLAVLLLLGLFGLWWPTHPPLGDLPQHAAQIAWMHAYPEAPLSELLRVNLLTPYLFGYGLAWLLAYVFSVGIALKLLLTGALLGFVAGVYALLREADLDPDWTVLAVPLALGQPWGWGFLNYLVGLPLLLAVTVFSVRQVKQPTVARGLGIAAALAALVPVHVYISVLTGMIGGVMALTYPRPLKDRVPVALPFVTPIPVFVLWRWLTQSSEAMTTGPPVWDDLMIRPWTTLAYFVSAEVSWTTIGTGLLLVISPFLVGARIQQVLWRWAPVAVLAVLLASMPEVFMGTYYLRERLAPLAFVFFLFALQKGNRPGALLGIVPAIWLLGNAARMVQIDTSQRGFRTVLAAIPPDQRVLSVVLDRDGPAPIQGYLHLPHWYAAEQGGLVEQSFAAYFPQVIRYRPGLDPELPAYFSDHPEQRFSWTAYDGWSWFILRTPDDPSPFFAGTEPEIVAHEGPWWLVHTP